MKCGYLGPEGSYSYLALKEAYPELKPVANTSFIEILEKLESGEIDFGFLPVENSTEGAVTVVMDSLLDLKDIVIQGEVVYSIKHHLFNTTGKMEEVKIISSHPQALEQCRGFFRRKYPHVNLIYAESTSAACYQAKEKGSEYAAVASMWAGKKSGLKVACEDIQDNRFNQTRFVKLGKVRKNPTGKDKTSIAFSFPYDEPGSLHKILKVFSDNHINLSRIESRPAKQELGQYIFFIDFNGHKEEPLIKEILKELERYTRKLYLFGSYPRSEKTL
ncbi:prephenate dehydratase/chorismate mutase / prephenate dehydratase [Tindallia magadiensis]|uniref:Prephenate dehydratase n=1 Tax=Tindallia magadiensis TaxID=69895 RepID=A0A1I3DNR1_9FIRM|nr:prephenate dehydratase [Tindallia magadiensis]SFH88365.1 prephenate dehydratase/chorismate mutase / prephenate dehydratase [Tindallia magadiensis]